MATIHPLKVGPTGARTRHRWPSALLSVALSLMMGCATGTPVGFRVAASSLRYRPAIPHELPPESPEDGEECGEPPEGEEDSPLVRLETSDGAPLAFTPRAASAPVRLDEEELREALARLVLQERLSVRPANAGPRVVLASTSSDGEVLDRSYQHLWKDKGLWCEPGQSPREDGCLSLLERGFSMDRFDRLKLAVGFSMDTVLDGVGVALRDTFSPKVLGGMVVGLLASYVLLLAAPEPVFTKGLALVLTVYLAAYLGAGPFRHLVLASRELADATQAAHTFKELEEAGHRFGLVLGEDGARIVLLLLTAALGGGSGLITRGPLLPGFAQAAALARVQLGIRLGAVAEVQSVTITASGGLVLGLAPTALAMTAQGPSTGTARTAPAKQWYWHHIATDKFFKSLRNGGPWSPKFKLFFDKAGMTLNDASNKVYIQGHKGPHPQAYHEEVYRRLSDAVRRCTNTQQCRESLMQALQDLARDISTPGSRLNRLVTE